MGTNPISYSYNIHRVLTFLWLLLQIPPTQSFEIPQPKGLTQTKLLTLARIRFEKGDNDDSPMHGKIVVITGAAGGIGRELSNCMYSLGATVIAMDRNENGLHEMKDVLKDTNRFIPFVTQHEDLNSVARVADQIKDRFETIDILINNAGLSYTPDYVLGSSRMKSAHGKDLCMTVNYLSHFLFTEKLLPNISNSTHGRIVHLTSTFHWKVDGSALLPALHETDKDPVAFRCNPNQQHSQHIERSYANSKLAQIWHSRSLQESANCGSVCACPTWAATGIAGKKLQEFLDTFAFPIFNCGPGITSALNAILRTDGELGDALNNGKSFVGNSRTLDYIGGKDFWFTSRFITDTWILRDIFADILALILLIGQRYTHDEFIVQKTSPESYNDAEKRKLFHEWSLKEVGPWL